jgi:hypothetical protein
MFGHSDDENNKDQPTEDNAMPDMADSVAAVVEPQEELTLPPMPAAATTDTPEPTPDAELSTSTSTSIDDSMATSSVVPTSLTSLKQEALRELSPLIGHLDQTPDEKYTFAKMMYEETKNQDLLSKVYEAAKGLIDEKAKAKAIYDIVQKINDLG